MKVLNSVQSKCQSVDMNFGLQKKTKNRLLYVQFIIISCDHMTVQCDDSLYELMSWTLSCQKIFCFEFNLTNHFLFGFKKKNLLI